MELEFPSFRKILKTKTFLSKELNEHLDRNGESFSFCFRKVGYQPGCRKTSMDNQRDSIVKCERTCGNVNFIPTHVV